MIRAFAAAAAVAAVLSPFGGTAHRKTEEGNRRYEEKAYEDALRAYTEAQAAAPEAPELRYNLGNVLYRQEGFEGAREEYGRALLSAAPSLAAAAAYNLGNALYREGRFEEALEAYRKALGMRPDDADAKRNLELALRALRREQQREREGPGKGGEPQPQGRPEPRPGPGGDEREEREGAGGEERQDGERGSKEGGGPRMSREEAARLLDSVGERERESRRERAARRARVEDAGRERDW